MALECPSDVQGAVVVGQRRDHNKIPFTTLELKSQATSYWGDQTLGREIHWWKIDDANYVKSGIYTEENVIIW
jgi:hypothetical protein